ncbi:MAG: hypothetical protein AAF335_00145 [Bacteroidota bacterium]
MHWDFRGYLKSLDIWPTTRKILIERLREEGISDDLIVQLEGLEVNDHDEFFDIDEMWPEIPNIMDYSHLFNEDDV